MVLFIEQTHARSYCTGPLSLPPVLTLPDTFKLVQLGSHFTSTLPSQQTWSNLFTMEPVRSASGRLTFDCNAFLYVVLLFKHSWRKVTASKIRLNIAKLSISKALIHYRFNLRITEQSIKGEEKLCTLLTRNACQCLNSVGYCEAVLIRRTLTLT